MDTTGKQVWLSKTFWVNLIAIGALLLQSQTGLLIDLEAQMFILAAVNGLLRFVTKEPVTWGGNNGGFARLPLLILLAALLALAPLAGCALVKQDSRAGLATQAMLSTQAAVVGIAEAADRMCGAGTLSQPQCDQVRTVYEQAAVSYDLSAGLLAAAIAADSPDAWQNYRALHDRFMGLYLDMTNLAIAFGLIPAIEGADR